MIPSIKNAVGLVTGANGGLGQEFVAQALARGASKVYATARIPRAWNDPRIVPLELDVTDESAVVAAATLASDVTIVINNAGIFSYIDSLALGQVDDFRLIFETNFFGAINVMRAFAPVVGANGGGAFLNVHSVLSWIAMNGAYSASKAALWSATNSMRVELADQGTHVLGLHMGFVDTPIARDIEDPKSDAADIVGKAFDGLELGDYEVLADEFTLDVKQGLSEGITAMYPEALRE
jgi:NAD(P)-dependent dehydrogenase (short-subunit alcohol dehydrogenase family)